MDEKRKRREKQEAENNKTLQKKLATMEAGISRSLEITTGVTQALKKRNNRIKTQFDNLEIHQTIIIERINADERRREEVRGQEENSSIKYILTEFRGNTSSIRYMNQLKQYWEAVKPRDNDTHYLIERLLSNHVPS